MKTKVVLVTSDNQSAKVIKSNVKDFFRNSGINLKVYIAKSKAKARHIARRHRLQIVAIDKDISTKTKKLVEYLIRNGGNPHIFFMDRDYSTGAALSVDVIKTSQALCEAIGDIRRQYSST